jgi:hypothetical protein
VQPRDADWIPFAEARDAGPKRSNNPGTLMAWNERQTRLDGPVSIRGVQVGVTDTARHDLDEHFAWPRGWDRDFFDREWLTERAYYRSRHRRCHRAPLSVLATGNRRTDEESKQMSNLERRRRG